MTKKVGGTLERTTSVNEYGGLSGFLDWFLWLTGLLQLKATKCVHLNISMSSCELVNP